MAPEDQPDTEAEAAVLELPEGAPSHLPLRSLVELLQWYQRNLANCDIRDPRGYRVLFPETEFVHLVKLVTKQGVEPKNRQLTIRHIETGRIKLDPSRLSIRRSCELSWARLIIEDPWKILPNWQALGNANPGEVYVRNFGTSEKPVMRALVCGIKGQTRRVVTHFPRNHFSKHLLASAIWP